MHNTTESKIYISKSFYVETLWMVAVMFWMLLREVTGSARCRNLDRFYWDLLQILQCNETNASRYDRLFPIPVFLYFMHSISAHSKLHTALFWKPLLTKLKKCSSVRYAYSKQQWTKYAKFLMDVKKNKKWNTIGKHFHLSHQSFLRDQLRLLDLTKNFISRNDDFDLYSFSRMQRTKVRKKSKCLDFPLIWFEKIWQTSRYSVVSPSFLTDYYYHHYYYYY